MEDVSPLKSDNFSRRTLLKAVPAVAVAAATSPLWLPSTTASAASVKTKVWLSDAMGTGLGYAFVREDLGDGLIKVRSYPGGIGNDWDLEATYIESGDFTGTYDVRNPNHATILENDDVEEHSHRELWEFAPDLGDNIGQPEGIVADGDSAIGLFMQYRHYAQGANHWTVIDLYTEVGWMRRVFNEEFESDAIDLLLEDFEANGRDWLAPARHGIGAADFATQEYPEIGVAATSAIKAVGVPVPIGIGLVASAMFALDFIYHFNRILGRLREAGEYYTPIGMPAIPGQPQPHYPAYFPDTQEAPPDGTWD